jgi:hypothetical protein
MPYKPLLCPKCGNELMPINQVRQLTRETYETDSVGTAVALIRCQKCHQLWGFVVASDCKSWTIIGTRPENLPKVHQTVRNLMRLGIPVARIAEQIGRT